MKRITALLLAVCLAFGLCACGKAAVNKTGLTVYAAASLAETLMNIKELYEKENDVSIMLNFESSGTLKTQISMGAECDVFISAGQKQMDGLESEGMLLEGSRVDLLENMVCLAVPDGNPAGINGFDDLAERLENGTVMLAIGNMDVPVGQYSIQILEYYGLSENELMGKLTYGSNAKEVTTQVKAGSVDCGIVYSTDAFSAGLTVVQTAGADMCAKPVYPAAVMKNSKNSSAALDFMKFLQSSAAREVFGAVGFMPAD